MKKKLFLGLMAAAAVSFTACQKDEVLNEVPQDQPIEFGTYVGRGALTKATSIDTPVDLQNASFGVFAFYTNGNDYNETATPNFMYNQKVEGSDNGTKWSYTPVKYWPNNTGDKISFFAYAPYGTDSYLQLSSNTKAGDPILTYSVSGEIDNHKDVVYSNTNNKNRTKQTIDDKINFNFAHSLSRIGFSAQVMVDKVSEDPTWGDDDANDESNDIADGTTIAIKEIEIYGSFYKGGNLNLNSGQWSGENQYGVHTSFLIPSDKLYNCNEITTTKKYLNTDSGNANSTEATDKGYLMIIPQYLSGSSEENALKIRVKYTVTTTDANLNGNSSVIENDITTNVSSFKFEQGKAYNFALQLGLTSVKLSASVSGWEEGGDIAVNVPINTTNN